MTGPYFVTERQRLSNPCLLVHHTCASLGPQYTCMYRYNSQFCANVCRKDFCYGGDCRAVDQAHTGTDGTGYCT